MRAWCKLWVNLETLLVKIAILKKQERAKTTRSLWDLLATMKKKIVATLRTRCAQGFLEGFLEGCGGRCEGLRRVVLQVLRRAV